MRKPALLQHLTEEGHGDPETAGAAVKIVQVLTGHEMEPESDPMEWGTLEIQNADENELLFYFVQCPILYYCGPHVSDVTYFFCSIGESHDIF